MSLSTRDHAHIQTATDESQKSSQQTKHGCVAVANGKILGKGYNSNRTYSSDGFICNTCSRHAEIASLRNMYRSCCSNHYGKYSSNIKVGYLL